MAFEGIFEDLQKEETINSLVTIHDY